MITEHLSSTLTSMGPGLANHLWQSTAFAAIVGLLTMLLRKHQARIRFSLWLTASIKFLVPFSLLITLGGLLPKPQHIVTSSQTGLYTAIDVAGQPFSVDSAPPITSAVHPGSLLQHLTARLPLVLAGIWLFGALAVLLVWYARWRQVSAILRRASPIQHGREIRLLWRLEAAAGRQGRMALFLSPERMEPGVFGIVQPVLIWPERLSERLDEEQMEAILAHEMTHQRRHDNLAAAIHMLVEILFWFHPMVWWMERRMVEERERACDEAVVGLGGSPEAYAEGLLKACRFCVEAPLSCVSGITGADLSRRVRAIMTLRLGRQLSLKGKLLLAMAAAIAIAGPVTFGVVSAAQTLSAQSTAPIIATAMPAFDVASITPDDPNEMIHSVSVNFGDHEFTASHVSLQLLIEMAYGVDGIQIPGAPAWIASTNYTIEAKIDDATADRLNTLTADERESVHKRMLVTLLEDRFSLKLRRETKLSSVYSLVVDKGGPKLKAASPGETYANGAKWPGGAPMGPNFVSYSFGVGHVHMTGQAASMQQLVGRMTQKFSQQFGRKIVDNTHLSGNYDFELDFQVPWKTSRAQAPDNWTEDDDAIGQDTSLFNALRNQLGLRLMSEKEPVELLVIDHVQRASEN